MKLPTLEPAGTAEILRATQRDELMEERIHQQASDILLKAAGNRIWMKYQGSLPILSRIIYAAVTTLSDIQTLGEEYTGIIQINSELKQLPSKKQRFLALLLECFGSILCERLIAALKRRLLAPSDLTNEARAYLLEGLGVLKSTIAFLTRVHKGVFYWSGEYFQLSKRLAGIRYVLIRRWLKDRSTMQGFKLLSAVSLFQLFAYTVVTSGRWAQTLPTALPRLKSSLAETDDTDHTVGTAKQEDGALSYRCSLCLEPRTQDTATPCGHVFCWNCIAEWLQTRAQCPLCRDFVEVSRLIPIQNMRRLPKF